MCEVALSRLAMLEVGGEVEIYKEKRVCLLYGIVSCVSFIYMFDDCEMPVS